MKNAQNQRFTSINNITFFRTSETILAANYGTRKRGFWTRFKLLRVKKQKFQMGRILGKRQFLDLDTSASNTTELDPYKFTHFLLEVVRSMGSFGFQIWLERRSSRIFCFLFSKQNVTIRRKRRRWARKFYRFRPENPPNQ